jgi:hypothetical protein
MVTAAVVPNHHPPYSLNVVSTNNFGTFQTGPGMIGPDVAAVVARAERQAEQSTHNRMLISNPIRSMVRRTGGAARTCAARATPIYG